ncbi:MAG: SAM-dependent methyltransferase [Deltaproteobacteria bacterium]
MSVGALSPRQGEEVRHQRAVANCYGFFGRVFPDCGFIDYTDGLYHGDPAVPFDEAQHNQVCYVLDEVRCSAGTRVLDVGCGNGRLLEEARRRGAVGVGITISPDQLEFCRRRGLDVRLLDYKKMGDDWSGQFDAVVANGPIEHFVHPREAAQGRTDEIYREMFRIFHRAIDPASPVRKFINTTIHFVRPPRPEALLASPWSHKRGSDNWHWAWLQRGFGGFYPTFGQFERCAAGCFDLVKCVDGTQDYHFTSEEWLRRIRHGTSPRLRLRLFLNSLAFALRHPRQTFNMLYCMLGSESWNWQFRGADPPTRLLRQTWDYRP